jgi:hypothetical protein
VVLKGERRDGPDRGSPSPKVSDDLGEYGADRESSVAPHPVDPDRAGSPRGWATSPIAASWLG